MAFSFMKPFLVLYGQSLAESHDYRKLVNEYVGAVIQSRICTGWLYMSTCIANVVGPYAALA